MNTIKKVKTQEELVIFNNILNENWKEEGYEPEPVSSITEGDCFLIGEIGTIMFKSSYNHHDYKQLEKNCFTVEIDKVSILPGARGKGHLQEIFEVIEWYAAYHSVERFISETEFRFFLALKRFYRKPLRKIDEVTYFGRKFVTTVIDVSEHKKVNTERSLA